MHIDCLALRPLVVETGERCFSWTLGRIPILLSRETNAHTVEGFLPLLKMATGVESGMLTLSQKGSISSHRGSA